MSQPNHDEWYLSGYDVIPGPNAPVYIKSRGSLAAYPITAREFRILRCLKGCRSKDDHIAQMSDSIREHSDANDTSDLSILFDRWVSESLLRQRTSAPTLKKSIETGMPSTKQVLLSTVTADRPEAITRWLSKVPDLAATRDFAVLVIDDSRDCDLKKNSSLQSVMNSSERIELINRNGRQKWADALVNAISPSNVDRDVVEWGLLGSTEGYGKKLTSTGAARNALLVGGIDNVVLTIDDDIVPRFAAFCDTDDATFRFGDSGEYYDRLYPNMEEMENNVRRRADPTSNLIESIGPLDIESLGLEGLPSAGHVGFNGTHPRVVAAHLGTYGGRVYDQPYRSIRNRDEFRAIDLKDSTRFDAIQRYGLRAKHATAVTLGRQRFAPGFAALDGSWQFPPFPPWGRQEDDVFWLLATWLSQEILDAEFPTAVYHDTVGKAGFSDLDIGRYHVSVGQYNVLITQTLIHNVITSDPVQKYGALVRRLREIGSLRGTSFREFLRQIQTDHLTAIREEIESQITVHREERTNLNPGPRELLLRRYQDSVIRELSRHDAVVPKELRDEPGTIQEKLAFLQTNYRRWAEFLEIWPAIREAARTIGSKRLFEVAAIE